MTNQNIQTSKLLANSAGIYYGFQNPFQSKPVGLVHCHQVHSKKIVLLRAFEKLETILEKKADGLITDSTELIGIQTADCIPVLAVTQDQKVVGAIHAGWRGLSQGILTKMVETFSSLNKPSTSMIVALGPCIEACCFEVGPEVRGVFQNKLPFQDQQPRSRYLSRAQAPVQKKGHFWFDLRMAARLQLESAGVPHLHIEDVGACTYCGPGELASHRRSTHEGTKSQRQWSWIGRKIPV